MSESCKSLTQTERIALLNDLAREGIGTACNLLVTVGILALPYDDQSRIKALVKSYNGFDSENDPYGERDFGVIYQCADHSWTWERPRFGERERVFWKIDYLDWDTAQASEDPADPFVTARVLTIMLAEEY